MNTKKIITFTLAFTVLTLPALVLAHGGANDGDGATIDTDGHHAGASALVVAGSAAWWGLIVVSAILMSALSYWVYRYVQVAPVKKVTPETKK